MSEFGGLWQHKHTQRHHSNKNNQPDDCGWSIERRRIYAQNWAILSDENVRRDYYWLRKKKNPLHYDRISFCFWSPWFFSLWKRPWKMYSSMDDKQWEKYKQALLTLSVFIRWKKKDNNKKMKEAEKRTDEKEATKLNQRNFNKEVLVEILSSISSWFLHS